MNRILLVTGSYPPDVCGVGDYSFNLINANPDRWKVYTSSDWRLRSLLKKIKQISKDPSETIVIQYPTEGYGWSIVPQLLCMYFSWFSSKRCIVAIHEFANRTLKAKLATSLFWISNKIIFTSDFERDSAISTFPLLGKKSSVIKIISNIPAPRSLKKWDERDIDLTYFGHLRPNKGLEDFYSVSRYLITNAKVTRICIIGQVLDVYKGYFENLQKSNLDLHIEYKLNATVEVVSETLNRTKVCFLPFPDGLSERRGSFLAAILGGTRVVSYNGKYVTPALRNIAIITDRDLANETINEILTCQGKSEHEKMLSSYNYYVNNNIPDSWIAVSKLYEKFARE